MRTVSDIAPKVLPYNDVPGWAVASIELFLDVSSDILLDIVFLQRGGRNIDSLLLHLFCHVNVLNDGLWTTAACVNILRACVV